jgi:hypothetical protein
VKVHIIVEPRFWKLVEFCWSFLDKLIIVTLTSSSWPRQGFAKVRAKRNPESHISCSWECGRVWGDEPPHSQVSSHFGSWNPDGFSNFQRTIVGVKVHFIKEFLTSLESSWNVDVWKGLTWPIWVIKTQVIAKKKVEGQIGNLTLDH